MDFTNFATWFLYSAKNRVFRMWEFRRIGDWTPLELESKYMDQSQYKSDYCQLVSIKEAIELPDKDILLGLRFLYEGDDIHDAHYGIEYRRLSQIQLSYYPEDTEAFQEA